MAVLKEAVRTCDSPSASAFLQSVISFHGSFFVITRNGLGKSLMFIMAGILFAVGDFKNKAKKTPRFQKTSEFFAYSYNPMLTLPPSFP